MASDNFTKLINGLNQAQREAVEAIDGPVMVIAGPGTGKTQVLTLRIANILKQTDASPDSILALTFTESGAYSMRKRLVEIIGPAGYRVHIHTFHSFCNEVIKNYPDSFPRVIGATNVSDVEKIIYLKEIIDSSKLEILRPYGDPYYYLHDIKKAISELKRDNLNPTDFAAKVKNEAGEIEKIPDLYHEKGAHKGKRKGKYDKLFKSHAKNLELTKVYEAYEERLSEERRYDYEDMIMEVISALKSDSDLLLRLQEEYQYLLADEHQDTNTAQNILLELLSGFHEQPNLFVVGDEKQAIFRFQGASLENFLYFKKRFPEARVVTLSDNYRSAQPILDGAHSLMKPAVEADRHPKLAAAKESSKQKIRVAPFTLAQNELLFIASEIKRLTDSGVNPEEIAILYRDNKDVLPLIETLEKETVPFVIESDQNILLDPEIAKFISILRAVNYYGDEEYLAEVFHLDIFDLPHLDVYKILKARRSKVGLYDLISNKGKLSELELSDPDKFSDLARNLSSWRSFAKNRSLLETFELIARESGLVGALLGHEESLEAVEKLSSLFDEAKRIALSHRGYKLADFMLYLELMLEHNIVIKKDVPRDNTGRVRLMTAHRSKGLEFEHVYIVGATDGHFGNRRARSGFVLPGALGAGLNDDNDERRLFYVALTRAKKQATISYASQGEGGKLLLPSQFVTEIDEREREVIETAALESEYKKDQSLKFRERKQRGISGSDKEYLCELFDNQGLSVTGLNNFLECPWQYFYQSLVRIPRPQTKHEMYGTAIHEALRRFFDKLHYGEEVSEGLLLKIFKDELSREPLSDADYDDSLKKGEKALSGYYKAYSGGWHTNVLNEFDVRGVMLDTQSGEVRLRGKIDKIELLSEDGRSHVVDYKTAKPKSRNEIEGKSGDKTGNYKRQLVFYKLLLDGFDNGKYKMEQGLIDFVEPNDSGKYKREMFEITPEDLELLKRQINDIASEIREFSFWESRCGRKECRFCALREMMK